MEEIKISKYEEMMNKYPILFQMRNEDMTKTCMCWGICCDEGWYNHLNYLCDILECFNHIFYTAHRIRIQADQVKEKYGELRFYYSIVVDPKPISLWFSKLFSNIENILNKLDYKKENIVKKPERIEEFWEEISKKEFENKIIPDTIFNPFGWKFKEEDDKYFRNYAITFAAVQTNVPTKHKFLYALKNFCGNKAYKFSYPKISKCQEDLITALTDMVDKIISDCEKKCWNTCEICGYDDNANNGVNLITTSGYIKRICKNCSEKH